MKKKYYLFFIFLTTFLFISDNGYAKTVQIVTNTGTVTLTGGLEKDIFYPGEDVYAAFEISIGSTIPTAIEASGSVNGGFGSFFGGTYISGYSRFERSQIGNAPNNSGTYNANFSYSYSQPLPEVGIEFSGWSSGYGSGTQCYVTISVSPKGDFPVYYLNTPVSANTTLTAWARDNFSQSYTQRQWNVSTYLPAGASHADHPVNCNYNYSNDFQIYSMGVYSVSSLSPSTYNGVPITIEHDSPSTPPPGGGGSGPGPIEEEVPA